jgi:hypothetical protein
LGFLFGLSVLLLRFDSILLDLDNDSVPSPDVISAPFNELLFGRFSYDETQYGFTSTNATLCLKKENFRFNEKLFGSFSYDEIQYGFFSTNATFCLKKENLRPILLESNNDFDPSPHGILVTGHELSLVSLCQMQGPSPTTLGNNKCIVYYIKFNRYRQ